MSTENNNPQPHSHYCKGCNKLLLKSDAIDAEVVCHRCKHLNIIKYFKHSKLLTLGVEPSIIKA